MSYPYPQTSTTTTKYKKLFRPSKYILSDDIEILTARRELLRKALETPKAHDVQLKAIEEYLPSLFAAAKVVAKDGRRESIGGVPGKGL
ncbi:hypothetical protein HK097_002907 [Rhizophlyctis rosea]|uniref:Uncharacterized protein n=1 Tax=Rhizophlyctis rosea TaxID=64517 RepID=A0AAD5SF94_9FUNG|nr:hypothetical protein HK097_002907 [Rhizophlyctis rosea]